MSPSAQSTISPSSPGTTLRRRLIRALVLWLIAGVGVTLFGGQGDEPSILVAFGLAAWGASVSRAIESRMRSVVYGSLLGLSFYLGAIALQWIAVAFLSAAPPYRPGLSHSLLLVAVLIGIAVSLTVARERELARAASAREAQGGPASLSKREDM